jgi:cobalt-zinc-cadmium efflux system outer membrane protein
MSQNSVISSIFSFGTLSGFLSGNTQELLSNIIDNYRKRNISAVEFTDLYETFNDNIIQLLNLEMEMLNYIEMINFQTDNYFN